MSEVLEPIAEQNLSIELLTNKPGTLKTIKRNGKMVEFDQEKIKIAITKAFIAVEGNQAATSNRIHQQTESLTNQVMDVFKRRLPVGGTIHIEEIQDQVELL